MKQEFLKELGLTDEQIQAVINENNKEIEVEKKNTNDMANKLETTKTELSTIKEQLQAANTTIKSYEEMDIEGIKQSIKDWETKYETDTKALKDTLEAKDYEYSAKEYLAKYKFTSDLAKKAAIEEFKSKGFKLENGVFLGADEYMKQLQETNPGAFENETNNPLPTIVKPTSSGAVGEIKTSLSEMMKMANLQNN